MMTYQEYFNLLLGLVAFLASWWLKVIWESIKELRESHHARSQQLQKMELLIVGEYAKKVDIQSALERLVEKVDHIDKVEALVASRYVTKSELQKEFGEIKVRLERIQDKLDSKADK